MNQGGAGFSLPFLTHCKRVVMKLIPFFTQSPQKHEEMSLPRLCQDSSELARQGRLSGKPQPSVFPITGKLLTTCSYSCLHKSNLSGETRIVDVFCYVAFRRVHEKGKRNRDVEERAAYWEWTTNEFSDIV